MTTRLPSLWRFLSVTVFGALIGILAISQLNAQSNVLNTGFRLDFLKSSETASVDDEVVSNVVKAVNNTSKPIRFSVDLASPQGWKVINDVNKIHTVASRDSMFIPIRLVPSKETAGNVNYFISATAYSEFGNALASTPWTLEIKKISAWKLSVSDRQVVFPNDADSSQVRVRLQNNGNAVEDIRVTFTPDVKLQVMDENGNAFRDNTTLVTLPVGIDTSFMVKVKVLDRKEKGYFFTDRPDDQNTNLDEKRLFRLQIQAANPENKKQVKGRRVDFVKLSERVKFDNDKGSSIIPLSVELNSYNLLSNFTNFTLDFKGEADLGRQRHVRYNYQAIVTSNVVSGTDFLPSNRFLQYASPKLLVAAGNIGENMGLLLNGEGVKAQARLGKFEIGGIYVGNSNRNGRLAANNLKFYGARLGYRIKRNSNIEVQMVNRKDEFNFKDGDLYRLKIDHRISKYHNIGIAAGISNETDTFDPDSVFEVSGYGAELRYGGRVGKLNIALTGNYSSPSFLALQRGSQSGNVNLRYTLKDNRSVSLRAAINQSRPVSIIRGFTFDNDLRRRNIYELQYEWRTEFGTVRLFPRYTDEELLGLQIQNSGAGLSYSSGGRRRDFRLFSKFFAGFSKVPGYEDIDPYLVAQWENRLKYKNLNAVVRYNYGPASITDNFRIVNDGLNPQSVFISAFATMYFRKIGLSIRPRFNSSYESVLARWRVTASQDLSYYAKSGYTFTLGTELLMINQGESPLTSLNAQQGVDGVLSTFKQSNFFLRIGVKKDFAFRRPGVKSYKIKVAVFKDLDGNGIRDSGEDFVENVLIKINGKSAITGASGSALFENLNMGSYSIESQVLGDSEGWFNPDNTPLVLAKDETVFIPLTRGVQINGRVIVQKATYSALVEDVDLDEIRISAVGEDERVYSGLTDGSGEFRIFVPFGKYTIRASGAGIDKRLQFAQDNYALEINNASAKYQLTFYLIEKNRRINIKKFDNN